MSGYELVRSLDFEDEDSYAGARNDAWVDPARGGTASTEGWAPIGTDSDPYTATFEGNEHTLSSLFINRPSVDRVGLFGAVDGAVLRRVRLDGRVTGKGRTGSLVGEALNTTINACHAAVNIDASGQFAGGLVGNVEKNASVTNCSATGNIEGNGANLGGLVGGAEGSFTITSCYATGNIEEGTGIGGLVGQLDGATVTSCYATGNLKVITM